MMTSVAKRNRNSIGQYRILSTAKFTRNVLLPGKHFRNVNITMYIWSMFGQRNFTVHICQSNFHFYLSFSLGECYGFMYQNFIVPSCCFWQYLFKHASFKQLLQRNAFYARLNAFQILLLEMHTDNRYFESSSIPIEWFSSNDQRKERKRSVTTIRIIRNFWRVSGIRVVFKMPRETI